MSRAADLAHRLGQNAEAVCRHYLPKGRRQGQYWICGDVHGTPGRSLYVRLTGPRAGKWTDAAIAGEHGDLLDLIALNRSLDFRATLDEARSFLSLPIPPVRQSEPPARRGSSEAARRLWVASKPIRGTPAERWLMQRGIVPPANSAALRFHPRCYYRGPSGRQEWPALIAAVTDLSGNVTGVHRSWLAPDGGMAPVDQPRRALGNLAGNAVRFGVVTDTMLAAEGIETALALKTATPTMPAAAALSAAHLAALILPPALHRLYVAIDNDAAGRFALGRLRSRHTDLDIRPLAPRTEDFNADLLTLGSDRLRDWIGEQLAPDDSHLLILDGRQCA